MALVHDYAAFYQGDEWTIDGVLYDGLGGALDLSGLTGAAIAWRLIDKDGALIAGCDLDAGIAIADAAAGAITIALDEEATAAIVPGSYRDQLRVIKDGKTMTLWAGAIEVKASFFV